MRAITGSLSRYDVITRATGCTCLTNSDLLSEEQHRILRWCTVAGILQSWKIASISLLSGHRTLIQSSTDRDLVNVPGYLSIFEKSSSRTLYNNTLPYYHTRKEWLKVYCCVIICFTRIPSQLTLACLRVKYLSRVKSGRKDHSFYNDIIIAYISLLKSPFIPNIIT